MKLTFHESTATAKQTESAGNGTIGRKAMGSAVRGIALGIALTAFSPMVAAPMGDVAYAQKAGYDSKTDPFAPDARIKDVAASVQGDPQERAQIIFDRLKRGAKGGVKVVDGSGRPPRSATETIDKGGDCTEFATLVVSVLKESGTKGGAKVVHFTSAPEDTDHMVPYVKDGERKIIIDLQAKTLGSTAQGKYSVVMELTLDQAAEMYHREWGDDLRDKGKKQEAIKAYETALKVYDGDAYVHQNLGILYEKTGDMANSAKQFKRATELDSKYAKDQKRGSYNEELQAGEKAFNSKKWAECARHFQNAIDSGENINGEEKSIIESNRDACKHNANR